MSIRALSILMVLVGASVPAARAGDVVVRDGPTNVDVQALRRQGSYVRDVFVEGASQERVLRAVRGPANGPLGFAPGFVSETPVREQVQGDRVFARSMRIQGAPAAAGSTVRGRFTALGMEATLSEGMVSGWFKITVTRLSAAPDGRPRMLVREVGAFSVLREAPKGLLGVPGWALANLTPMGWLMQAVGGGAVSAGHVALFELGAALRARLGSGLPQYE